MLIAVPPGCLVALRKCPAGAAVVDLSPLYVGLAPAQVVGLWSHPGSTVAEGSRAWLLDGDWATRAAHCLEVFGPQATYVVDEDRLHDALALVDPEVLVLNARSPQRDRVPRTVFVQDYNTFPDQRRGDAEPLPCFERLSPVRFDHGRIAGHGYTDETTLHLERGARHLCVFLRPGTDVFDMLGFAQKGARGVRFFVFGSLPTRRFSRCVVSRTPIEDACS